ncbi:MAG: family 20 glycosylhydrolase [Paracoccaceae bacterium]
MVPIKPVSGCTLVKNVGGYSELVFPTGSKDKTFSIELAQPEFKIQNLSWLPRYPFLREVDGTCTDVEVNFTPPKKTEAKHPVTPETDNLRLVPQPTSWEPSGNTITIATGLSLNSEHPFVDAFKSADELAKRNGIDPLLGGEVKLTVGDDFDGPEDGYLLKISETGIVINANSRAGAFYAAISLVNLNVTYGGTIPCGLITDAPRFEWRGQQLDCARHFYEPDILLRFVDLLALMKLNRFHWHFNDDETFRLEVECYPEIWQKTRMRGEGKLLPGLFGGGKGPAGGSYSLDFARDLIEHAKKLEIEVLPEIEIPAHAFALIQVFPDLYDDDDESEEQSVQGYIRNTMNPAKPFMWEFVENLIRELAGIFPFGHIHLGCDERPPKAWMNSPAAKKLMQQESLASLDDLQGWTMEKIGAIVKAQGCQPCAWEEAAYGSNGGIGNDAILFSWTGQGPGLEAARKGYKVVMSPAQHLYFDMAKSNSFNDCGGIWAGALALGKTVEWLPVPADEPKLEKNIIGVEGAFWGELTTQDNEMESMIAPRILGLAEIAWRTKENPADAISILQAEKFYNVLFRKIGWSTE